MSLSVASVMLRWWGGGFSTVSSYSGVSGPAGKVEVNRFAHWQRCEECSEWEEEWNERRERVYAGAEREVASSRAPAAAAPSPGRRAGGRASSAENWEGSEHPGNWRLQGPGGSSEFTPSTPWRSRAVGSIQTESLNERRRNVYLTFCYLMPP